VNEFSLSLGHLEASSTLKQRRDKVLGTHFNLVGSLLKGDLKEWSTYEWIAKLIELFVYCEFIYLLNSYETRPVE
jgi:hypothetical protein